MPASQASCKAAPGPADVRLLWSRGGRAGNNELSRGSRYKRGEGDTAQAPGWRISSSAGWAVEPLVAEPVREGRSEGTRAIFQLG